MLATVISDILFRMGKRRERMRTGRVVASLVSGHPPFAPFEFVMDAITYIPLASASCSGSKWGAMVAWRNLSESIRFRIGYWTIYEGTNVGLAFSSTVRPPLRHSRSPSP